jgi:uncharacterized membrane protein YphA (DoxX/SURF4 family)
MATAIVTVHWANGFFERLQYNLLILVAATAIAATAGRFSLDHAFGWDDN